MAFITADRVKDTSTTTGTGNITVSGSAAFGYQTFSNVLAIGDTFYYCVQSPGTGDWEVGVGTYTSVNTFVRTTVLASSNGNSLVSFSSDTKNVFMTLAADKTLQLNPADDVNIPNTLTADQISTNSLTNYGPTIDYGTLTVSDVVSFGSDLSVGGTASVSSTLSVGSSVDIGNATSIDANSSSAALRITQTGAGNSLLVEDSANPDSTPFVINASGTVVIGDTTSQNVSYRFQSVGTNGGDILTQRWSASTGGGFIRAQKSRGAAVGTRGIVSSGDTISTLSFDGDDGTDFVQAASIIAAVDGTPGTNDMPGRLTFSTTADGASLSTERMRIDSAGQIGIGGAAIAGATVYNLKNATGAANTSGFRASQTVQSDSITSYAGFITFIATAPAAFTLASLYHMRAIQGSIGSGSVVTNQFGFAAETSFTGATNNYGFYGNIAAPTSGVTTSATITALSQTGTTVTVTTSAAHGYTNGQSVTIAATANATDLVFGVPCTILTVGTTDFTLIGAASNTVGVSFTATGAGTGTGTVTINSQGSGKTVAGSSGTSFTYTATSATFASITVTGTVTVSTRYNIYVLGTAPNAFSGNVTIFGAGGLGYSTGSGGAVTQATSRTTGVTLNKTNGAITLVSAAGLATYQSFTVTNSTVAATDTIILNQKSGTDKYILLVTAVAAGSFQITFATTGGVTTEQPVINFAVIKAVAA
jgi:hypothetical protein